MNDVQIFNYKNTPVRTVEKEGETWWALRDVCQVLNIAKADRVAARLDDDEKGTHQMSTPGGPQEMTIINEPGLYNVVLRSDKPEAKEFKRWVTHEVLPAIRRNGAYALGQNYTHPIPETSPGGIASLCRVLSKNMIQRGCTPNDVALMMGEVFGTYHVPVPTAFRNNLIGQLNLFDGKALEGGETA